jgi:hypothetical protein
MASNYGSSRNGSYLDIFVPILKILDKIAWIRNRIYNPELRIWIQEAN